MGGALEGVRVLEFGHAISAPHCCQLLADHGADVVKVEPPAGDTARLALPMWDGISLYFAAHNRGKRSLALDLKHARGRRILERLVERADVVVTNYSARATAKLGLTGRALHAINPRLVFVHVTGFGNQGAFRHHGAYDGVIQAVSGIPSVTGAAGEPTLVGVFLPDHLAAYQAALSVLLGLEERRRTGAGPAADLSMLDGYFSTVAHWVGEVSDLGLQPQPNRNRVRTAFANTYPAADGHVYLAPLGLAAWTGFCEVVGHPEWIGLRGPVAIGERREELEAEVAAWTRMRTRQEIVTALRARRVPCGPVNSIADAVASPELRERGMVVEVESAGRVVHVPGDPVRVGLADAEVQRSVPALGAHTREVLAELGLAGSAIRELAEAAVIAVAEEPSGA